MSHNKSPAQFHPTTTEMVDKLISVSLDNKSAASKKLAGATVPPAAENAVVAGGDNTAADGSISSNENLNRRRSQGISWHIG